MQGDIDSGAHCSLGETDRVVEQHLCAADADVQRWQPVQIGDRGEASGWSAGVSARYIAAASSSPAVVVDGSTSADQPAWRTHSQGIAPQAVGSTATSVGMGTLAARSLSLARWSRISSA
jgi:hypothetical protein